MDEQLYLSVSIQNTEKFNKLNTYVPFFLANILNKLTNFENPDLQTAILPLNNIGLKIDRAYGAQTELSRYDFCTENAQKRLEYLKKLNGLNEIQTYRDDEPEFFDFIENKLDEQINHNRITVKDVGIFECKCGHQVEDVGLNVNHCNNCQATGQFVSKTSKAMFFKLPEDKKSLIENKLHGYDPKRKNSILSKFRDLPDEVVISRKRDFGFSLEKYGLEEKMLDPKLGMSLLPEYIAQDLGVDKIVQITGSRHVTKGVHFSSSWSNLDDKYLLLAYFDERDFKDNQNVIQGYSQFYQAGKDQDLSTQHAEQITREFLKISRQTKEVIRQIETKLSDNLSQAELSLIIINFLNDFSELINQGSFVPALKRFRDFINLDIGKNFIAKLEGEYTVSPDSLAKIKSIVNLFNLEK